MPRCSLSSSDTPEGPIVLSPDLKLPPHIPARVRTRWRSGSDDFSAFSCTHIRAIVKRAKLELTDTMRLTLYRCNFSPWTSCIAP